jgi:hypothetical protein
MSERDEPDESEDTDAAYERGDENRQGMPRTSMKDVIGRWRAEDDGPMIVSSLPGIEGIAQVANVGSPPSGPPTASGRSTEWSMESPSRSTAEKELAAYRDGKVSFAWLLDRWAKRQWDDPPPTPEGADIPEPGKGTWGEVDAMWADGKLTDTEYEALCEAAYESSGGTA